MAVVNYLSFIYASYIIGKIGGQFTAQAIVFTFSYGISLGDWPQ